MNGGDGSYKDRIERAIRRQQRKQVLSKEDSRHIIDSECPFCEYIGDCDRVVDESSKGHTRHICKLRSNEVDTMWIEANEDRPHVEIGKKYGKLTVLESADNDKHGNPRWKCQCECGSTKDVLGLNLLNGRTTTCGHRSRHINDAQSNTGMGTSTVNIEGKKRKYIRGSSINPDGSKHVFPYGYHSIVGTSWDPVVYVLRLLIEPIEFKCPIKNEIIKSNSVYIESYDYQVYWLCSLCAKNEHIEEALHYVDDDATRDQILEYAWPSLIRHNLV
jgi:hypothetical protein